MQTAEVEKEFAIIIHEKLVAKFQDEFVFEPILVQKGLDLDGDPCLHAYIVFEGDQKKLDPAWTAALPRFLWPHAQALGFPGLPLQSFVRKSEWPHLQESIPCGPLIFS